jgi:hypothetical protein
MPMIDTAESSASATASAASAGRICAAARSSAPPPPRPPASSTTRSSRHRHDAVKDKETGEVSMKEVTLDQGRGQPPDTTLEASRKLQPVRAPKIITAGNASQLSDGASACV